jgi:type IV pilus assembly protein PilQ
VISDDVRASVSKWPIAGDLPLIGQFFRFSNTTRRKTELVIMVTPRVVDDVEGGVYGYGYAPGDSGIRRALGSASL